MNQLTPITGEAPLAPNEPFKKWTECQNALTTLTAPLQQEDREKFVSRITASPQRQHMAFELLWLLQDGKQGAKLRWIEGPMLSVLSGGVEPPTLTSLMIPSDAGTWVHRELQDVHTLADWKKFLASGRHLWVLYAILRTAPNTQVLIQALSAFTECVVRCQNTDKSGKPKKRVIQATDPAWIIKLIKAKIPAKSELPKAFLEQLFAIIATATLSEDVRFENDVLRFKLDAEKQQLANEEQLRATAEQNTRESQAKLNAADQALEETKKELEEEKLHTTRQGGFNVVAKKEAINHVLAAVRRGTSHHLENIRGFADREKPNSEEILALVTEIERHLAGLEEEVAP